MTKRRMVLPSKSNPITNVIRDEKGQYYYRLKNGEIRRAHEVVAKVMDEVIAKRRRLRRLRLVVLGIIIAGLVGMSFCVTNAEEETVDGPPPIQSS